MHDKVDAVILTRAKRFYSLGSRQNSPREVEAATILFAFTCELTLKALGADHGHNLADLFGELPEERQAWLVERYTRLEAGNFVADVNRCKDLFKAMRYWHEKGGISAATGLCRKLARFLVAAGEDAIQEHTGRRLAWVDLS